MTRTFLLDGRTIPFAEGQTVMDAAIAAGVYIPHLCHHPDFKPQGSCRLCTVEIDGRTTSACTLPARDGLVVKSETDELNAARRTITRFLFVEGNHTCPSCEKSGSCTLQAVAYHLDVEEPKYPHFHPRRAVDASHPDVFLDRDRCIYCELCVRASRDVDGKSVFGLAGRGIATHLVVNSPSGLLVDSTLEATDRAVDVCPVGAILPKRKGFVDPIGERRYDLGDVSVLGERRVGHEEGER